MERIDFRRWHTDWHQLRERTQYRRDLGRLRGRESQLAIVPALERGSWRAIPGPWGLPAKRRKPRHRTGSEQIGVRGSLSRLQILKFRGSMRSPAHARENAAGLTRAFF